MTNARSRDFSREPIENVIHQGIKADIELLVEQSRMRGALLLTMAGIDAMAFITMPAEKIESTSEDFTAWVDRYLHLDGPLSGAEVWGSRCGLLHTYGIESRATRNGVRQVGYFSGYGPPLVRADIRLSTTFVIISAEGLIQAFFRGIDRTLTDYFGDPLKRPVAEERLRRCIHQLAQGASIHPST